MKDDEGIALGNNAPPAVEDADLEAVASAMADKFRRCLDIWVVDRKVVTVRSSPRSQSKQATSTLGLRSLPGIPSSRSTPTTSSPSHPGLPVPVPRLRLPNKPDVEDEGFQSGMLTLAVETDIDPCGSMRDERDRLAELDPDLARLGSFGESFERGEPVTEIDAGTF